ncbi:MAG: hypothetical protein P8J68_08140 [Arenicellaceae bacterium]|jgi:hypothetical protein|nr:hypothetical protein [Arenicellaceae bacterium]
MSHANRRIFLRKAISVALAICYTQTSRAQGVGSVATNPRRIDVHHPLGFITKFLSANITN